MRRVRGKTGAEIISRKYKTFDFEGDWRAVFGTPEKSGLWLVYGAEKQGKTWFCLKLGEYLSRFEKVMYVSAEQGTRYTFSESLQRARIDPENRNLVFVEYTPLEELKVVLAKQRAPKIVIIDNLTVYNEEFKRGKLREVMKSYKDVLFIMVAHEEKGEPYTATAKLAKRLAEIIVRVEGLASFVSGRCEGGWMAIDEQGARLYHDFNKENAEV